MIYNYWWQISTDNLSNLDSPRNFSSSSYNLSLHIQNFSAIKPKRFYSTSSIDKVLFNVSNINDNESIKFDSLEQGCEQIKFKYLGVSGVYKLTSKIDNSRFYIGSSNNLARRINEYIQLIKGLRNSHSACPHPGARLGPGAELEISPRL